MVYGHPEMDEPRTVPTLLHQMDLFWWKHYGSLHRKVKERRRSNHQGNCALIRYADDWLLLTNGSKSEAYRLRGEFQRFLAEELKLELSVEKTRVTRQRGLRLPGLSRAALCQQT